MSYFKSYGEFNLGLEASKKNPDGVASIQYIFTGYICIRHYVGDKIRQRSLSSESMEDVFISDISESHSGSYLYILTQGSTNTTGLAFSRSFLSLRLCAISEQSTKNKM